MKFCFEMPAPPRVQRGVYGFEFVTRLHVSPLYMSIHPISDRNSQKVNCILVGDRTVFR